LLPVCESGMTMLHKPWFGHTCFISFFTLNLMIHIG
jgi:hypothetical protein